MSACLNHILARLHEFFRILGRAVDQHLVVKVRASATPGAADLANPLIELNLLPSRDDDAMEMGVAGDDAVTVIHLDHFTVALFNAGKDDGARRRAVHRRTVGRHEVDAGMERLMLVERIGPAAEAAGDRVLRQGRRQRQGLDDPLQFLRALGISLRIGDAETLHLVECHIRATLASGHGAQMGKQLFDIDTGRSDELLHLAGLLTALIRRVVGLGTRRRCRRRWRCRRRRVAGIGRGRGGAASLQLRQARLQLVALGDGLVMLGRELLQLALDAGEIGLVLPGAPFRRVELVLELAHTALQRAALCVGLMELAAIGVEGSAELGETL